VGREQPSHLVHPVAGAVPQTRRHQLAGEFAPQTVPGLDSRSPEGCTEQSAGSRREEAPYPLKSLDLSVAVVASEQFVSAVA